MANTTPVYERKVSAETESTPEFQSSFQKLGESENFLGSLGAQVAQKASNEMASQLGSEAGKNPHGNLGPPLTDFDKNFAESYKVQSQATLGLQAEKLISDSNLAASKASRMTPGIIAQTQQNISAGLQKIYEQAPSSIRPHLEATYGAAQLNQVQQLNSRMLDENHEELRNNTILANDKNAELAHSLAASGNFSAADGLVKATERLNSSTVSSNVKFTPQAAKVGVDTVRQSMISGRLQYEYNAAVKAGKGDEFLKSMANRPNWISDADYPGAAQSLRTYVGNQKALQSNYEDLTMTQFQARIATNASSISGAELQSTLEKLSPINAAKLNLDYIKGYKAQMQDKGNEQALISNWNDSRAWANAGEKAKNDGFNSKVDYAMKADPTLTREAAENQVASSAGGTVPVFTNYLKNALNSGDPAQMVAVTRQMDDLQSKGNGHALDGLDDKDMALYSDIKHNFNPADPSSAARIIAENKQNQDPKVRKLSEQAFADKLFTNTKMKNTTTDDFVLDTFGMNGGVFNSGNSFDSPWSKSAYATDILSMWQTNYINTGRDDARALDLTKEQIQNKYGKTSINGDSQWTLHPIEQACNFKDGDKQAIVSINNDIIRQIESPLAKLKEAYDNKTSNTYWSVEKGEAKTTTYSPYGKEPQERLIFTKHSRNGVAIDTEKYPLRLVGNNYNWDLNVETAHGPMSIFLAAPEIGVHTYSPDVEWINNNYHNKTMNGKKSGDNSNG